VDVKIPKHVFLWHLQTTTKLKEKRRIKVSQFLLSVVDQHHFDADPDPDPTSSSDADQIPDLDPDPNPSPKLSKV
jgi:hypothetical protein